ncbi:MAG: iron-sulfur cluster repair di-iron protein, ric [Saccharofermentanales bacterium]
MAEFKEVLDKHLETLELYVPVVDRVHGVAHPEFHGVRKLFEDIVSMTRNPSPGQDYSREFELLRNITNNYAVPCDVCETYEAVYTMLAELDAAYANKDS